MQILNIKDILETSEEDYLDFGRKDLKNLITFYGIDKKVNNITTPALIDSDVIRGEYRLFKRMVKGNCTKMTNSEFWNFMGNDHQKSLYSNTYKLGMIANVLTISTAICERGFLTMNNIKNDLRNFLGNIYLTSIIILYR